MSEHFILNKYQKSILLISILSMLLIAIIVGIVGIYPLFKELREEEKKKLSFAVTTKITAIEQFLSKARNITFQINSRTQIRKKLEAYNNKEITYKELIDFSQPKLKDAMRLSKEVSGLTRLGKNGDALIKIGENIPDFYLQLKPEIKKKAYIYGPVFIHHSPHLILYSYIFNRQSKVVGADLVLFESSSLKNIIQNYSGLGETGESLLLAQSKNCLLSFFPFRNQNNNHLNITSNSELNKLYSESKIKKPLLKEEFIFENKKIAAIQSIKELNWSLIVMMNKEELYYSLNNEIMLIIAIIIIFCTIASAIIIKLLEPITKLVREEFIRKQSIENELKTINTNLEKKVKERTEELENKNKELEAFIYSVSHDLRSPLRSLSGFSEILKEDYSDCLDEEAKTYLERISISSNKMNDVIDALLQLSRINRDPIKIEKIDLGELSEKIFNDIISNYPDHNFDLKIKDNIFIYADRRLMNLAIENLLSNAVKFSLEKNPITIEISQSLNDKDSIICIKDNGIGFQPSEAEAIFNSFKRSSRHTDIPGSGVGLAIVKKVMERHHGNIWAKSNSNEGSSFFFSLSNEKHSENNF